MSLSDLDFVSKCIAAKNSAELEASTGLKKSTITQRRTALRKAGWVIPEFPRGVTKAVGGVAGPTDEDLAKIAELTGQTLEQVKEASVKIAATVAARGAANMAGKAKAAAERAAAPVAPAPEATANAPAVAEGN